MEDFYAILQCNQESTFQDIKSNFQKLALKYHPDKVQAANSPVGTSTEDFVKINKAWKVLGNESSRKEYDALWKQRCMAQDWPIQDDVNIKDFNVENDSDEYIHGCRCGGLFRLTTTDVFYRLDIVACEFCSLCVRVHYDNQDCWQDIKEVIPDGERTEQVDSTLNNSKSIS